MNYAFLVSAIVGLTQWLKKRFSLNGWKVVCAGLIVSIIANLGYGYVIAQWQIWQGLTAGVVIGAVAGGWFDLLKEILEFAGKIAKDVNANK